MNAKDLKQGDIFTYSLDNTREYTAVFVSYTENYLSLVDIAYNDSSSAYKIPSAGKLFLDIHDLVINEVIGYIDLFKPLYDKYPELLV